MARPFGGDHDDRRVFRHNDHFEVDGEAVAEDERFAAIAEVWLDFIPVHVKYFFQLRLGEIIRQFSRIPVWKLLPTATLILKRMDSISLE